MKAFEWKWGAIIGGTCFGWLVLSWALEWNRQGIGMVQVTETVPMLLSMAGYALAMRSLLRRAPETSFPEGLKSGALIAVVVALVAVVARVVYFRYLDPGWTDYMVEETKRYYAASGLDEASLEAVATGARSTFGSTAYAVQAGAGGLLQGVVFSALALAVLRWLNNR